MSPSEADEAPMSGEAIVSFLRRLAVNPSCDLTEAESALGEASLAARRRMRQVGGKVEEQTQVRGGTRRRAKSPSYTQEDLRERSPKRRRASSTKAPANAPAPGVHPLGSVLTQFKPRQKADMLMHSVSVMFHEPPTTTGFDLEAAFTPPAHDRLQYTTLEALISPLRKQSVWENWNPRELGIFESGLCTFGKDFHQIAKLIGTKSTNDIVSLYYHWKQTSHYHMWKSTGKQSTCGGQEAREHLWHRIQWSMMRPPPPHSNALARQRLQNN